MSQKPTGLAIVSSVLHPNCWVNFNTYSTTPPTYSISDLCHLWMKMIARKQRYMFMYIFNLHATCHINQWTSLYFSILLDAGIGIYCDPNIYTMDHNEDWRSACYGAVGQNQWDWWSLYQVVSSRNMQTKLSQVVLPSRKNCETEKQGF